MSNQINKDPKGWIDQGISKLISRKLLVFLLSTAFFCLGMVPVDTWAMIAVAYTGVQGFADIVDRWRRV